MFKDVHLWITAAAVTAQWWSLCDELWAKCWRATVICQLLKILRDSGNQQLL